MPQVTRFKLPTLDRSDSGANEQLHPRRLKGIAKRKALRQMSNQDALQGFFTLRPAKLLFECVNIWLTFRFCAENQATDIYICAGYTVFWTFLGNTSNLKDGRAS